MQWIKATERLPEKKGEENKVIVKGRHPKFPFVDYGFKNYSDTPNLYINLGSLSFLTTSGEGDFHSSYPIEYVEWLDESESTPTVPGSVQEAATLWAKEYLSNQADRDWIEEHGEINADGLKQMIAEKAYIAGATSQPSSPVPEDVKEACKKYADEHADSKWNKAAELERAFLAGHAYKGQQLPPHWTEFITWKKSVTDKGNMSENDLYHYFISEVNPQPAIPLSIVEALEKANPYTPSTESDIYDDRNLGEMIWQRCVSKLRELLQSQPVPESVESEYITQDQYKAMAESLNKPTLNLLKNSNVPFEKWTSNIHSLIEKHFGIEKTIVYKKISSPTQTDKEETK